MRNQLIRNICVTVTSSTLLSSRFKSFKPDNSKVDTSEEVGNSLSSWWVV